MKLRMFLMLTFIIFVFHLDMLWAKESSELRPSPTTAILEINKKGNIRKNPEICEDAYRVFTIDGYERKGHVKAVELEPGSHTITLRYEFITTSAVVGAGIIGGAIGGAIAGAASRGPSEKRSLKFLVKPGRKYQVAMRYGARDLFLCWIEDSKTGEIVSKLVKGSLR